MSTFAEPRSLPVEEARRSRRWIPLAAIAAVALGVVVAGFALTWAVLGGRLTDTKSALRATDVRLAATQAQLKHTRADLAATKVNDTGQLKTDVAALQGTTKLHATQIKRVSDCLPELMQFVNSISLNESWVGDYLTTGTYINYGSQVSKACSSLLYGTSRSGD